MFPDGEYEIASHSYNTESDAIAIRHGFVPDSMDSSAPQRFYRDGSRGILIAQPALSESDPIYFEGKSLDVSKEGEGFYLSLDHESPSRINLHKLSSSFRFAKARSVSALSARVDVLEADSRKRRGSSDATKSVLAPSPQKPVAAQILIGDSDFDDLNSDLDEFKFPQFPVIENKTGLTSTADFTREAVSARTTNNSQNGQSFISGSQNSPYPQTKGMSGRDSQIKVAKTRPISPGKYPVKPLKNNSKDSSEPSTSSSISRATAKSRDAVKPTAKKAVPKVSVSKIPTTSKLKQQNSAPSSASIDDDFADLEDELHKVLESTDTDEHDNGSHPRSQMVSKEESSSEED